MHNFEKVAAAAKPKHQDRNRSGQATQASRGNWKLLLKGRLNGGPILGVSLCSKAVRDEDLVRTSTMWSIQSKRYAKALRLKGYERFPVGSVRFSCCWYAKIAVGTPVARHRGQEGELHDGSRPEPAATAACLARQARHGGRSNRRGVHHAHVRQRARAL